MAELSSNLRYSNCQPKKNQKIKIINLEILWKYNIFQRANIGEGLIWEYMLTFLHLSFPPKIGFPRLYSIIHPVLRFSGKYLTAHSFHAEGPSFISYGSLNICHILSDVAFSSFTGLHAIFPRNTFLVKYIFGLQFCLKDE